MVLWNGRGTELVHGDVLGGGGGGGGEELLVVVVQSVVEVVIVVEVVVVGQAKVVEAKATTAQMRVVNFILLVERVKNWRKTECNLWWRSRAITYGSESRSQQRRTASTAIILREEAHSTKEIGRRRVDGRFLGVITRATH